MESATVEIVTASPDDVEQLAAVHHRAAVSAYAGIFTADTPVWTLEQTISSWQETFDDEGVTVIGASTAGPAGREWLGTVVVRPHPDFDGEAELLRLYVDPERWGEGIGSRLHDAALEVARRAGVDSVSLAVLEDNHAGRSFYERRGWQLVRGEVTRLVGDVCEVRYRLSFRSDDEPGAEPDLALVGRRREPRSPGHTPAQPHPGDARPGRVSSTADGPIVVYGTSWCNDCKRAKQFLGEQRVHYTYIDVDSAPEALAHVESVSGGRRIIPVIEFADGSRLVEPSNAELAAKLGLAGSASRSFYDLVIVGSGPAGLTAALYAAREGIDTLVIERAGVGGQAGTTERLDNFPGFPEGVSGEEFAERLRRQTERFGVEILPATEVTGVASDGAYRVVHTAGGEEYCSYAVLLAVGSTYRRLGIPGEEDFIGAGVHFCATCDGAFYRDEDLLVVGGGNSAGEEGLFLTRFARHVTILTRDPQLTASRVVVEKVREHPDIDVITGSMPVELRGGSHLETVVVEDTESGERRELHPGAMFVFIGLTPNTGLVADLVELDEGGFIHTDVGMQTSFAGVFAAGDCRSTSTKQAASAAGEGAAAAIAIRRFIEPLAGGMPLSHLEMPVSVEI